MNRTYKYRLNPTKEQDATLDFLLWQGRKVWNEALAQRIAIYEEKRATLNQMNQWPYFRDLRHDNPETLGKLSADSMNKILRRLDKAFQAFFRRVKQKGGKPGFPRFKNRQMFTSLEFTYGNGVALCYDGSTPRLYVMNVGEINMTYHRPIPECATPKMIIIYRHACKWYAVIQLELPDPTAKHPHPRRSVGIDIGLKSLVATSKGQIVEHHHLLQKNLARLRVLQRKAARQVKGSKRQKETYQQIAKLHEHIANQRGDFFHKLSHDLADEYALIGIENLPLAFMNRSKYLAASSYDAGIGAFRDMLIYKAEECGGRVIAVNPAYTTQTCSKCGHRERKKLSQRFHHCPKCGKKLDRDVNAARNILRLAKAKQLK